MYDWKLIDADLVAGMTTKEAAFKHGVKMDTIQTHIRRTKLAIPSNELIRNLERRLANVQEKVVVAAVESWLEKGEQHRQKAFEIGHESVKKFTARAPKDFKELEIADKIARRAAGLDVADTVQQTLINVNERVENFEHEVVEATEVS
jgi:transposase